MKNNIKYILFILILLNACSKDQGNYEYNDVNVMTVTDLQDSIINGQVFDVAEGDTIRIKVKSTGTLPDFDEERVQYAWILDKDTLSKNGELVLTKDKLKAGKNMVELAAIDPTNQVSYLSLITVNSIAAMTKGLFVLAEGEGRKSIVYLKSTLNKDAKWNSFEKFGFDQEYVLGKTPISIDLISYNRTYPSFVVTTGEGPHPVTFINLTSMAPEKLINGVGKALSGGDIKTSYFQNYFNVSVGDGYLMDGGRVRYYVKGFLGEDICQDPSFNYDFGKNNFTYSNFGNYGFLVMGFDQISKRILLFFRKDNVNYRFPKPDLTLASDPLEGMEYFGSSYDFSSGYGASYAIILRKGDMLYNYQAKYDYNTTTKSYFATKVSLVASGSVPKAEMAVDVRYDRWNSNFYYAVGRTIYRFSYFSFNVTPYFTLPDDGSGDIVAWNFGREEMPNNRRHIGIATYNPSAGGNKKSSIYHYIIVPDEAGNALSLISKDLYVSEKVVDIALGVE